MKSEQLLDLIEKYRGNFVEFDADKVEYPEHLFLEPIELGIYHCHGMLDKMVEFVREGRMEKANRWLGFVQGVLWANGIYTLEDFKEHNRRQPEQKTCPKCEGDGHVEKVHWPGEYWECSDCAGSGMIQTTNNAP